MKCNQVVCPCKNVGCVNHGKCCACVERHKNNGNLPACLRHLGEKKEK